MLETKCVGDNFYMLVTKMAKIVAIFYKSVAPTLQNCHQLLVTNITVTAIFYWQVNKLSFNQARKSARVVFSEVQTVKL